MAESWSMEVKGIFRDVNLLTSLAKLKAEVRQAGEHIKSTTVEMKRMASEAKVLGGLLSLIGAGGFAALLMSAPRTAAALAKLKTWLELIFLILDEHLSPAVEWLADQFGKLYDWFKNLSPEWQKAISYAVGLAAILGSVSLVLLVINSALKTLLGWSLLTTISGWITKFGAFVLAGEGIIAMIGAVGIGGLLGGLGVMVLDKLGVLDWVSDIGESFRIWMGKTNLLTDALWLLIGPSALFGDLILVMVTDKTMEDFARDLDKVTSAYHRLKESILGIPNPNTFFGGGGTGGEGFGGSFDVRDVGGMASYTGFHWLKAGEQVSMQGASSSKTGASGTTITNDFGGATFVLQNGLDIDDFVEVVSRKQAEKSAWSAF